MTKSINNIKFFHTPNLVRKLYDSLIWSVPISDNTVFLTFDDGPNEEITTYILDRLKALNWTATFFCVGENVRKNPKLFQRILDEGHTVGNHTDNHANGWKTKQKEYLNSISKANKVIPSSLFRPPYGKIPRKLIKEISKDYKIVMWSFMAYDFDKRISHDVILQKAQKHIIQGSIIVLHDNEKFIQNEKAVFEIIVSVLQEKGLKSKALN
ncbi:MAG TPA: polysaccharide deacetylase family protein [Crocinitomicaceae bacterium]|nr:polysaccharide deacetylase family protein [Crocinitomicaceae bacterium]